MKHGAAAGVRPERADWTIDQAWDKYAAAEHAVWRTLFERQTKLLPGRACDEFVDGMKRLPIGPDLIPALTSALALTLDLEEELPSKES